VTAVNGDVPSITGQANILQVRLGLRNLCSANQTLRMLLPVGT